MDWDDFRFVHALARGGTVRQAGQLLGVHASTVIRRLDALERRVQVKLFSRSRDGMQPTAAGRELLSTLDAVARELETVTRRLRAADASLSGRLVLCGPELLLMAVAAHLRSFRDRYPALSLYLRARIGSAASEDADLTIRITREPPPDLVGRNLGPFAVALYGSPEYIRALAADGGSAGCLWVDDEEGMGLPHGLKAGAFALVDRALASDSGAVRLAALRAGQGIGPLPCVVGDADPGLVRYPELPARTLSDIWLLSHPDLRGVARVRALVEFVQSVFGELQTLGAPRSF
jgi:DNA-binding transcriptional LysR family regulator